MNQRDHQASVHLPEIQWDSESGQTKHEGKITREAKLEKQKEYNGKQLNFCPPSIISRADTGKGRIGGASQKDKQQERLGKPKKSEPEIS